MRERDKQMGRVRQYLLGALPEDEQWELEREFFADGALLDELSAAESELVDAYVRGQLTGDELRGFEQHYLATSRHGERVAFAGELLRAADEAGASELRELPGHPRLSWWARLLAGLRAPRFALGALVAALLLLVAGAWLITQRASWRAQLNRAEEEQASQQERARALQAEITRQQERNADLNAELERRRDQPQPAATAPPAQPGVLSFMLLAGVRGGEQRTLRLAPAAASVRLLMKIERGAWQQYQVSLRPLAGGASWSPTSVKAATGRDTTTIAVVVPARRLPPGDYILTLTATDASYQTEELDRYFFRVSR